MPGEGVTAERICGRKRTSRSAGDEGDPVREIEEGRCRDWRSGVHGKGRDHGDAVPENCQRSCHARYSNPPASRSAPRLRRISHDLPIIASNKFKYVPFQCPSSSAPAFAPMSPIALEKTSAAVLRGPKDLAIEERTLYRPPPGSCQLKVVATGLCGSDCMSLMPSSCPLSSHPLPLVHYYKHGRNGDFAVRAPLVLGHESAGIITQVGPEVSNLKPGQRVAIECGIKCRKCDFCLKGRYNLCRNMRFCSSASVYPHQDGTLQKVMNHPAHVLHPYVALLPTPISVTDPHSQDS